MTELTGETRFPRIYSAIDNNAYPQSPAHIHEYNVFLAMHISLQVLSIGHGTSIVLDSHIIPQLSRRTSAKGLSSKLKIL